MKRKEFATIQVLKSDKKKIQRWAIDRDMHDYEIISYLVAK